MSDDLEFEADLDQPPETVWRALQDPVLREAWLAPAAVPAEQGGPIDCEVLEADPPHRLRLAWRGERLDSSVEFSLVRTDGGSRLRIVHSFTAANDTTPLMMAA